MRAGRRRGAAQADRFEAETVEFHQKLRQSFLDLARREPVRCVVIDATQPKPVVVDRIWSVVNERLGPIRRSRKPAVAAP
jgi:dTMP kinase